MAIGTGAALLGSALIGGVVASKGAKSQADATTAANNAQIEANKLDPRVTNMLYGPEGTTGSGLIDRYRGLLDKPQEYNLAQYGAANAEYLGRNAANDLESTRMAAKGLMGGYVPSPSIFASQAAGGKINAPGQNSVDLTGSFQNLIGGQSAENPYLKQAIQGGIGQSEQAFGRMTGDITRNLRENILPGIGQGAVIAGGYGGSRQGIAEGRAIGDTSRELARAAENFGNNNTTAAVGAQAGEFGRGQDRALSATMGLSGQQYGLAGQQAQLDQQNAQFNAGLSQGARAGNQQAQLNTNALNTQRQTTGLGAMTGLLGNAYGVAGAQDQYDINRAGQVNGLLQPYLSKNPVPTNLQPVYNNSGAAALGGAMGGLGLYNQFMQTQQPKPTAGDWGSITSGYSAGTGY